MSDLEILLSTLHQSQEWIERLAGYVRTSYKELQNSTAIESEDRLRDEEAFTARFGRLSDILVKRFYRLVAEIDDAPNSQVLDVLNHAHKVGLLDSVERMRELRLLRNKIAHEYDVDAPGQLLSRIMAQTPFLLDCSDRAIRYSPRRSDARS